ncbi:MAG: YciI-like protein [Actinomycetes bacterium]
MYLALIYDLTDDYLERRGELREQHLGLARAAAERGELALAGAFTEPADTALLVWQTDDRALVEQFVAQDPYVAHGLVTGWRIREWNVVVGGPA